MNQSQASIDWPAVLLGVVGTGGAVIAVLDGEWLWAAIIFLGSIMAGLLVVLTRRRRA
jgi:uncharacterized membrane protein YjjP (DUF1212 family)